MIAGVLLGPSLFGLLRPTCRRRCSPRRRDLRAKLEPLTVALLLPMSFTFSGLDT